MRWNYRLRVDKMGHEVIDRDQLRKDLIEIFSSYVKDPADFQMKRKARRLHTTFGNAGDLVDKGMRHAINRLVDIGWDLPAPPKPARKEAEEIIFALASRKSGDFISKRQSSRKIGSAK